MTNQAVHTTDRLTLHELVPSDAPFMLRLLNEPGWIRFIGDRGVRTEAGALDYITSGPVGSYAAHGFGLYLVRTKTDGQPVGICGLLKREALEFPDLGFAFVELACGLGYATESSRVVLDHVFATGKTRHALNCILAITDPENTASIKVLTKLGFVHEGVKVLKEGADAVSVFSAKPSGFL